MLNHFSSSLTILFSTIQISALYPLQGPQSVWHAFFVESWLLDLGMDLRLVFGLGFDSGLFGFDFRFWSLTLDSGLQSQDLTLDSSWLGIGLRTCSWLGTWLRTCSSWFGNGLGGGGFDLLTWDLFLAWDLTQDFLVFIWDLFILTWGSGLCSGAWVLTCLSWLWIGFKNSGVVGLGAFLQ